MNIVSNTDRNRSKKSKQYDKKRRRRPKTKETRRRQNDERATTERRATDRAGTERGTGPGHPGAPAGVESLDPGKQPEVDKPLRSGNVGPDRAGHDPILGAQAPSQEGQGKGPVERANRPLSRELFGLVGARPKC